MHQTEKKNSWCTSRGPHVLKLANVTTNPCLMWPHYISYVIKLCTKLLRSLRLGQGRSLYKWGGGRVAHFIRRKGPGSLACLAAKNATVHSGLAWSGPCRC